MPLPGGLNHACSRLSRPARIPDHPCAGHGLGGAGGARRGRNSAQRAALLFFTGILLFSGSLYGLALSGVRALGFITPLGGLALIAGWIVLALAALKLEKP